ncbi:bifunctional diaminohydroxyphosphoribosylaminopyrimidine deaminase/5-amino-6-(5-phosphoribosylamino)uracil reductase RibD [Polaribacter sp. KT 15]|uniref:bifunctional diaminohydroxyphosphoribosylaminopyrimidine deaminase/5-amino-6-(5-phosphoribosylamino)uracil reductase RibD n=1 Tax=Polaribacter sp. KT 15 TaxID=1896175 RepID=UPI00090B77D1|nr:bifunctional diaminohydroxyphosphoribosylaminopyrimidine deaminase/5-amino-6-(5-phosphoribosylamino)uracil reductase RibD [Polaribacter sp. KT 15]SHM74817.1 diaminohydroxyphosphoribosylaminopyrimidine deaminase [Polaribacter sp. KT 15]
MNKEIYIKRCLQIAENGVGTTRPNPSVGAVIVYNNKIIAEGFTSPFGGNHAEVNAINAVKDKSVLKDATIYVTLEPCSHFGKTPPCADLIVKHQFKQVVIGCLDSNTLVAGKGVKRLKDANINVVVRVLENECRAQHKRFLSVQENLRPYIILKWAETKDGFIAPETKKEKKPVFISNSYSQQLVHKLRSKEHAILVGTNTALVDNPKLNLRTWSGLNPVRVVLDRTLKIEQSANLFDKTIKTIVLTEKNTEKLNSENLVFEKINFDDNLAATIINVLAKHKIQSLIVEGGTQTLQTFINQNLWDEALVFVGNSSFKKGVVAPKIAKNYKEHFIKDDVLKIYKND